MPTLDWLWGRPQALLQRRHVSSVRVGLANGTKRTPSQNWGNLLPELHVPHRQCLAGLSNAFLLLLPVSGHLSRGFTVPTTKRAYSVVLGFVPVGIVSQASISTYFWCSKTQVDVWLALQLFFAPFLFK